MAELSAARDEVRLTVVAASRNDDHGGNLLARTQLFVDGLHEQAVRLGAAIELILVEWNPPPARPPLAQALRWPIASPRFQPRIVTVSPTIHSTYAHAGALPLFQMIAKNVGIRRARGRYVLATNIDILFSDVLVDYLAHELEEDHLYRADRVDIQAELATLPLPTPSECRALPPIRVHGKDRVRTLMNSGSAPALKASVPSGRWSALKEARSLLSRAYYRSLLPRLHTNACGDFTLTSKKVWGAIRGYPEWPMYSWHLDGLPLFQAAAWGVLMTNLRPPRVLFHLEHGQGSGWTPEGSRALFLRLDRAGIPYLTTERYRALALRATKAKDQPYVFNDPHWGLAEHALPEYTPS